MPTTADPTTDVITESFGSGVRVDREAGIIRGAKIIGYASKNGRDYLPDALRGAVHLYESAKVNIDHPEKSAAQPRSYSSRFGILRNVNYVEGQGLFGDLHYNPKHALADQVCWDAENSPESCGLSHNASVSSRKSRGRDVVERIVVVRSVDVVADPATTNSLFESHQPNEGDPMSQIANAINSLADATEADTKEMADYARKKIMKLKAMGVTADEMAEALGGDAMMLKGIASGEKKATTEAVNKLKALYSKKMKEGAGKGKSDMAHAQEIESLRSDLNSALEQIEKYETKEKQQQLVESINKELTAAGLDPSSKAQVSDAFSKVLVATESVEDRAALIADRASLLKGHVKRAVDSNRPQYSGGTYVTEQAEMTTEDFVRKLRS